VGVGSVPSWAGALRPGTAFHTKKLANAGRYVAQITGFIGDFAMRKNMVCLVAVTASLIALGLSFHPANAAVKVIGDFEGGTASPALNYASPYVVNASPVNWFTDVGITVPPTFVTKDDPLYGSAVTHGNGAMLYTFPGDWGAQTGPYLRLNGQAQMLADSGTYHFLMFDVTTFGADNPDWRNVQPVFNGDVIGFYSKDDVGDSDIQRDINVSPAASLSLTQTVSADLTGPLPPVGGDGKEAINQLVPFENPSAMNFAWQLVFVFQGKDTDKPFGQQVKIGIDNVRFCDTLAACSAAPTVAGDYNNDGHVNAADYTVWRDHLGQTSPAYTLSNETVSAGTVDQADYTEWKSHFGSPPGSGALSSAAVPEPSSVLLLISALAVMTFFRRTPH
jgi:hypothetical protein